MMLPYRQNHIIGTKLCSSQEPRLGPLKLPYHRNRAFFWVAVKELKLRYHNSETILVTIYAYYGN